MKKKLIKPFAILLAVFLGSLEVGWRFFNMVVCCKRGEHKKERKKWFELSHIRENHPRNGYAREYNESKAWCLEQKMQNCYIKSIDGLKLHALYLPTEYAKRIVILSHGYRGSRFGTLSFMAKYLHEHQC
ncbi:MAG: alpha/beta hydrolase, partial [Blautia wexlerae]